MQENKIGTKTILLFLAALVIVIVGGFAVGFGMKLAQQRDADASPVSDSAEQAALLETISALLTEKQSTPEAIVVTVLSESADVPLPDTAATVEAELTRLAYVAQEEQATQAASMSSIGIVQQNDAPVRKGPGKDYRILCYLNEGDQINLVGQNADGSWYEFTLAEGTQCFYYDSKNQQQPFELTADTSSWISASYLMVEGNSEGLPVLTPPPTEVPPKPTITPPVPTKASTKTPMPPTYP